MSTENSHPNTEIDSDNLYTSELLRVCYEKVKMSIPAIAKKFGVSVFRVYTDMKRWGIERRPTGRIPQEVPDKETLEQLLAEAGNERELARRLEISRRTLQRWRRQTGARLPHLFHRPQ
ncbi:MAG TPA: hypothetical protein DCX25_00285 [Candidatus Pacebacteria bacterium]|nr:MAG: hypothetical protein UX00_C0003G0041 [Microgenomates group bacterium GW2011_GWB1_45_17]KKU24153.1 MAG: hypothetical protein UX36_C0002G0136 [Microgenomates group bacterium GW2011_GWC1_46_15]KKU24868.1 MAG: hypothetical protein UX35_C0001G0050 [Microgenomates group bacterium GW2011_GWA1_46_15]HAV14758.1 hypothetical protein [Candidatus Paceibacterota bacterium]HCR11464.1 hypothetical protein [Candidatus Paceibacterota bacterium]